MKLTKNNYFTPKNDYLTCSKLKDFILSPDYFYKKHILNEIEFEQTPSMRIGSAVDCWLTSSLISFHKNYVKVERRNLKEPPKDYTELTPAEYEKVEAICHAVEATSVYKSIHNKKNGFKAQKILTMDFAPEMRNNNEFPGCAGIPDFYRISDDGKIATIIDLKTTSDILEKKFIWTVQDFGYYFQQAMYQILLEEKYPQIIEWESFILAVENDNILNRVRLFELSQPEIELEKMRVRDLIKYVCNYDFSKKEDVTWESAIKL